MGRRAQMLEHNRVRIRVATRNIAAIFRRPKLVARAVAADIRAVFVTEREHWRANVVQVRNAADGRAVAETAIDEVATVGLDLGRNVEAVFKAELVVDDRLVNGEVEEGDWDSR